MRIISRAGRADRGTLEAGCGLTDHRALWRQSPSEGECLPVTEERSRSEGECLPVTEERSRSEGECLPAEERSPSEGECLPATEERSPGEFDGFPSGEDRHAPGSRSRYPSCLCRDPGDGLSAFGAFAVLPVLSRQRCARSS